MCLAVICNRQKLHFSSRFANSVCCRHLLSCRVSLFKYFCSEKLSLTLTFKFASVTSDVFLLLLMFKIQNLFLSGHSRGSQGWVSWQWRLCWSILHSQPRESLQVLDAGYLHRPGQGSPHSSLLHETSFHQSLQRQHHQILIKEHIFLRSNKSLISATWEAGASQLNLNRIKKNIFTLRINYDVACNMDFHRFPVDEQYCEIKFESFGFTNKQVQDIVTCQLQRS